MQTVGKALFLTSLLILGLIQPGCGVTDITTESRTGNRTQSDGTTAGLATAGGTSAGSTTSTTGSSTGSVTGVTTGFSTGDATGSSTSVTEPLPGTIAVTSLAVLPGSRSLLANEINLATTSVHAGLYILTDDTFVNALINAKQRGLDVKVLIDGSDLTAEVNDEALAKLEAKGIPVEKAAGVTHHHAKYVVLDGTSAMVMTCNWSFSSFTKNREVLTKIEDDAAVTELEAIFNADFTHTPLSLPSTQWVLSPNQRGVPQNSRSKLHGLVDDASSSVFVAVQDINDDALSADLVGALGRGVQVRVLMADPAARQGKYGDADWLSDRGIEVRYLPSPYLHEKVLVADDRAYVGSHNFTYTALETSREVGLLVSGQAKDALLAQAEKDWASAVVFVGPP